MKYIILFILTSFTNLSFGQEYSQIFDHMLVRDIKQIQNHYLLHLDHLMRGELQQYILICNSDFCGDGLAFMDSNFNYKWIYVPQTGGIEDFWEDDYYIYILTSQLKNSKTESQIKLNLLKLDKTGHLVSKKKIDEDQFNRPNGSFEVRFDQSGIIYKITNIPHESRSVDYAKSRPGTSKKSYIIETLDLDLNVLATYTINGKYLYYEAFASKANQSSIVFSADSTFINHQLIPGDNMHGNNIPSVLLLQFNKTGQLTLKTYIGSGSCWVKDMHYQENNLIIAGSYKGNDPISYLPDCQIQERKLRTPRSYISDDLARNSFVVSLDSNLNVNWLNTISGSCDILFNSLSNTDNEIAISLHYKDSVEIAGKTIYSLKKATKYQYADPVLCFFNTSGKLISYKQLPCHSSARNNIFLFPDYIALHGSFVHRLEVYHKKFKSESKSYVYYLSFIERKAPISSK